MLRKSLEKAVHLVIVSISLGKMEKNEPKDQS